VKDEIINRLERIETKLDNVIKAMHDYDGNDEYGESSFEAFMDSNNLVPLEILQAEQLKQWKDERGKEDDDNNIQDERVVGDRDKHTGEEKKRNKRRYYKPKQTK
jgi:hypothetical protein